MKRILLFLLLLASPMAAQDSDPDLLAAYREYNAKWFKGKLEEPATIAWDDTKGYIAHTRFYDNEVDGVKFEVYLSKFYLGECDTCARIYLLHEMVHVALGHHHKCAESHCKHFQDGMRKLANRGALKELW